MTCRMDQDPWDWDIEDVVHALCGDEGMLRKDRNPKTVPDAATFSQSLRDHGVDGETLLRNVDLGLLKDELGLQAIGPRYKVFNFIGDLQNLSPKYRLQNEVSENPSPLHCKRQSSERASGYGSPVHGPEQRIRGQYAPSLARILLNPTTRIKNENVQDAVQTFTRGLVQHNGRDDHAVDLESLEVAVGDVFMPQEEGYHSSGPMISEPEVSSHRSIILDDNRDIQQSPGLRRGETYVLDQSGRKRRKLVLEDVPQSDEQLQTSQKDDITSVAGKLPLANVEGALPVLKDGEIQVATPEEQLAVGDDSSSDPGVREVDIEVSPVKETGKPFIDKDGRKRIDPTLLSAIGMVNTGNEWLLNEELDMVDRTDEALFLEQSGPDMRLCEGAADLTRSRGTRRADQIYLGHRSLTAEQLFYDQNPAGLEQDTASIDDKESSILSPDNNILKPFGFVSIGSIGNGKRLYVHHRMKHFLSAPDFRQVNHGGKIAIAVVPYPDRFGKERQSLSFTLYLETSEGIQAQRQDRIQWQPLLSNGGDANQGVVGRKVQSDTAAIPKGNDLLDAIGHHEGFDWNSLEKWKFVEGGDKILPELGDSGSEGEYDSETWNEIQRERGVLHQVRRKSKVKELMPREVANGIAEAISEMRQFWTLKKLPKLSSRAWRTWSRARRKKTTGLDISHHSHEMVNLETRLAKMTDEIASLPWSSVVRLKRQCKSLEETLFDIEEHKWIVNILESRHSPPANLRDTGTEQRKNVESTKPIVEDDNEKSGNRSYESDDSAKSIDSFVVSDDISNMDLDDLDSERLSPSHEPDSVSQLPRAQHDEDSLNIKITTDARYESSNMDDIQLTGDVEVPASPATKFESVADTDIKWPNPPQVFTFNKSLPQPFTRKKIQNKIISEPASPIVDNSIIDLTQMSDSVEQQTPAGSPNQEGIRTPPLPSSDPFRRQRTLKQEFRIPPGTADVIDLESTPAPSTADGIIPSSSAEATEPNIGAIKYSDVNAIHLLDPTKLEERLDRKRLLIWLISHCTKRDRRLVIERTHDQPSAVIQPDIWAAMKMIKAFHRKARGTDHDDQRVAADLRIASWFISFSQCANAPVERGFRRTHIIAAIDDEGTFEGFYDFMLKCFAAYQKPSKRKPKQEVLDLSTPTHRRQKSGGSSDNSPSERNISNRKKRKNAIPENVAAALARTKAADRKHEIEARQRLLQTRLQKMGLNAGDPRGHIVNSGKFEDQDAIMLSPSIGRHVQPHQLEGVQFMWRELTSDIDDLQGCLLAHTMGLGKTMQVISLLVTLAEATKSSNRNIRDQVPKPLKEKSTLVLCPPALIGNWFDEFLTWCPHPLSSNVGDVRKVTSDLKVEQRLYEITQWAERGGVLILGYTTFRDLVDHKEKMVKRPGPSPLNQEQHERVLVALLERPSIIVADEAHFFKSRSTAIGSAMKRFSSRSRIALTGSPLANNLGEYYSIIDWISPGYLGDYRDFSSKYLEPIQEGLFQDSTVLDQRRSLKMLQVLKTDLEPKVHRADISILKTQLKGKTEFVIRVPLTELQEKAYGIYVDHMLGLVKESEPGVTRLWAWLSILGLICSHPLCFRDRLMRQATQKPKKNRNLKALEKAEEKLAEAVSQGDPGAIDSDLLEELPLTAMGLTERLIADQETLFGECSNVSSENHSHKMTVLMRIIAYAAQAKERTLVFSHNISTLDYIEGLLLKEKKGFERLDGRTKVSSRVQTTKEFNTGSTRIYLISTRAGGLGLNLYGASRVVLMDDHFNPMYEEQAIGRAYRLGQQKHVYVYRLTVGGTFEEAIHNQSLFKKQLASRVVDKKNLARQGLKGVGQYLFPPKKLEQQDLLQYSGTDELVLDRILHSHAE